MHVVCICVLVGVKEIHIWEGWYYAHPSQLLDASGVNRKLVCPDWLWTRQKPAQICGAVAGMESYNATDFFFLFCAAVTSEMKGGYQSQHAA